MSRLLSVVAVVLALAGCGDVTPDKIERWKGTEKGPGKLRDAVKSSSVAPSLRAQALAALVEIGMAGEALAELKSAPEADRAAVVREAAPRIASMTHGTTVGAHTTRTQRQAKDALFDLRTVAPEDVKLKIDDDLINYTTVDLAGRMDDGENASSKILTTIGPRALPRLIELLGEPGPNQIQAAALLGQMADPASRARAADALVEAAKKASSHQRDVSDDLLRAVASVGGPHGNAFLIDQAEHGPDKVKERALLALAQGASVAGDTATVAAVLRIGGDKKQPGELREPAFQVAEKGGMDAVGPLVKMVAGADDLTRWRAAKAALVAGGARAVKPVLEALPETKGYKKEDFDDYVIRDLKPVGEAALPILKEELRAKSWVARAIAVRALGQMGTAADATALEPLTRDGTMLKGFGGNATLGSEARAAVTALKSKK